MSAGALTNPCCSIVVASLETDPGCVMEALVNVMLLCHGLIRVSLLCRAACSLLQRPRRH